MHTRLTLGSLSLFTSIIAQTGALSAKEINLPGTVAGGVDLCTLDTKACITTPDDKETAVKVLSYRDGKGEAVILLDGKQYIASPNQVSLSYKGCNLSLSSFVLNKFCPGSKR